MKLTVFLLSGILEKGFSLLVFLPERGIAKSNQLGEKVHKLPFMVFSINTTFVKAFSTNYTCLERILMLPLLFFFGKSHRFSTPQLAYQVNKAVLSRLSITQCCFVKLVWDTYTYICLPYLMNHKADNFLVPEKLN